MTVNQYTFEVVRDLATVIERLKPGESVAISVQRHANGTMLNWESSQGEPCGWSETSTAMEKAYYAKNKFHAANT